MSDLPGGEAAKNAGAAPGQRLREERERRGHSTQKVAEDLHVDPWIVEALEAGRFHALGAPVYAKGYLRKYAELLGLDGEALVAEISESVQPVPPLAPFTVAAGRRTRRKASRRLFRILVLIALAIAGVAWGIAEWRERHALLSFEEAAPVSPAGTVVEAREATAGTPANGVAETAAAGMVNGPPQPAPLGATTSTQEVTTPAGEPRANLRVRMSFTADSWVEIYDAEERRVFYDLGAADSVRSVTVKAPARVSLGNPAGMQIEIDGRRAAIPVEPGRRNVTHLVLDAEGRLAPAAGPARR